MISLIESRLKATGLAMAEAEKRGGLKRGFLSDLVHAKKTGVQGRSVEKLARALDVSPAEIMAAMGGAAETPAGRAPFQEVAPSPVPYPSAAALARDLPVYGTAAGSIIGLFEGFSFENGAIDYVRRPPALAGVRDAYAIFVVGDSMAPEHKAGDLRFVHPHRPPAVGDTVILQVRTAETAPLQAFIKVLKRRRPDEIVVEQHNPQATMAFNARTVIAIHRVMTLNDLFGL